MNKKPFTLVFQKNKCIFYFFIFTTLDIMHKKSSLFYLHVTGIVILLHPQSQSNTGKSYATSSR